MSNILIVVDFQNDFVDGALGSDVAQNIYPELNEYVQQWVRKKLPVIFTLDTHDEDYLNTQEGKKLPVVHCVRDTMGWQFYGGLGKYVHDHDFVYTLEKATFGSFELAEMVKQLCNGEMPDSLTLVGVVTDICVIANAIILKTTFPETPIKVISRLCAGSSTTMHDNALAVMQCLQINVE